MGFFLTDTSAAPSPTPVIEWEETECLLCGGRNSEPLVEASDALAGGWGLWFVVVQCQECGLCFTNPRPSATCIHQFYPSTYAPHHLPSSRGRRRFRIPWLGSWGRARSERHRLPSQGLGRLLDFGCGGGSFLERMKRQGWHVVGLDVAPEAVKRIRTQLGLRALLGSLPHPELKPSSFDVITMWQALEHVHHPLQVLREAHRLLVPGGKLIIAVPNIDSLQFRWFGSAWFGLDLPRHLTHFAPWTLHLMLERAGFHVEPIRMIRHSEWMRLSARRAVGGARSPHWYRWLTAKAAARLASWYSYLTHQADCLLVTAER